MSAAALLEVRNFCVDVADRAVLSEISFAIAPGTIVPRLSYVNRMVVTEEDILIA